MSVRFRRGTVEDSKTVFDIFRRSLLDLGQRTGVMTITGGDDPEVMAKLWESRRSLFEHMASSASAFWIAEREGRTVGYARAIERDGVWELTEFFVLPGEQSAGLGQELLERTLPKGGVRHRSIVATLDDRALARYLKLGVYGRFPIKYFSRPPEPVEVESDLEFETMALTAEVKAELNQVDRTVIGHVREGDHRWLASDRQGILYRRGGEIVGYGYFGGSSGPFALLNEADFPAVLGHAERMAHAQGLDHFGVEVPLINRRAVDYLLGRGYRMDAFTAVFMSDADFGQFERYVFFAPPLMI